MDSSSPSVAGHYDHLDRFYRQLWGEHVHHGLWTDPALSQEEAVQHLVHRVAEDARIGTESVVCDVGCGYGAPARIWAEDYGARVTGFTVSNEQYTYARRQEVNGPVPHYRLEDFLSNGLSANSIDAVIAIESLTHIRDQEGVFQEASRLLRPGGRFVACVWTVMQSPPKWARRLLLDPICRGGRLSGLPSAVHLRRWADESGLTVERLDDLTTHVRHTWTIVIRRFLRALLTDPAVIRLLLDSSESERVFAWTLPRIWLAQHLGVLRYAWLVAVRE